MRLPTNAATRLEQSDLQLASRTGYLFELMGKASILTANILRATTTMNARARARTRFNTLDGVPHYGWNYTRAGLPSLPLQFWLVQLVQK
jgi:hypothetical protein